MALLPIAGFKTLPIELSSTSLIHFLFIKSHDSKKDDSQTPGGRTLFVVNLPTDFQEHHLRNLFAPCGVISAVTFGEFHNDHAPSDNSIFGQKPVAGGNRFCHVVFKTEEGLEAALEMQLEARVAETEEVPTGIKKWTKEYRKGRPGHEKLKRKVDQGLREYDLRVAEEKQRLQELANKPDADGFITVTRHSRRNTNTDGSVVVTATKAANIKNLKPKDHKYTDMYKFQMRQSKRDQIAELRQKFEEDKKKIERMRAARKFNPF